MRKFLLIFASLMLIPSWLRADLVWKATDLVVEPGEKEAKATFHFKNDGPEKVGIYFVRALCSCTSAKADKEAYEKGEAGKIEATFVYGGRTGLQTKRIIVRTVDGKFIQLAMTVDIDKRPPGKKP